MGWEVPMENVLISRSPAGVPLPLRFYGEAVLLTRMGAGGTIKHRLCQTFVSVPNNCLGGNKITMRTIIWFIYFWLYLILVFPEYLRVRRIGRQGDRDRHDRLVRRHVSHWASRLLRLAGADITVTGLEHIPQGPVVFVGNHQGYFDIPLMISQLGRPSPLVAKKEIDKIPLIRLWMRELGCVFLDRNDPRQSMECMRVAQGLLQQGYSVVIFPEGTRNRGGEIKEFKAGGIRIATKAKVPIVPVCINGSHRLMESNHMWIRPAKVHLKVLPPVETQGLTKEEIRALPQQLRQMVVENMDR